MSKQAEPGVFELLAPVVHLDVAVRAARRAGAAPDAVVRDDPDLAVGLPHDPVHRAQQADGVLAVAACAREQQGVELQPPPVEPRVPVAALARVDAVVAVGADRRVDHQDLVALDHALLQQLLGRDDHARRARVDRSASAGWGRAGSSRPSWPPRRAGPHLRVRREELLHQVAGDREHLRAGVRRHARLLGSAEEQRRPAEHVALAEVLQDPFAVVVADRHLQEAAPHDVQVAGRRPLEVDDVARLVDLERRLVQQRLDLLHRELLQQRVALRLRPGRPPPVQLGHGPVERLRLPHQPEHRRLRELDHDRIRDRRDREQLLLVAEHGDLAVERPRPHHQDLRLLPSDRRRRLLHGAVEHDVQPLVELALAAQHLAGHQSSQRDASRMRRRWVASTPRNSGSVARWCDSASSVQSTGRRWARPATA